LQADRFLVRAGDLIYNDMWARHGSVAVVPAELDGCVASAHFPTWEIDEKRAYGPYLTWCFRSPWFWAECEKRSRGRNAIRKGLFKGIRIPLPALENQKAITNALEERTALVNSLIALHGEMATELEAIAPSVLQSVFQPVLLIDDSFPPVEPLSTESAVSE
jgi:hypothetical protein